MPPLIPIHDPPPRQSTCIARPFMAALRNIAFENAEEEARESGTDWARDDECPSVNFVDLGDEPEGMDDLFENSWAFASIVKGGNNI